MHIPVILTHPEVLGPPIERGVRYGHHFVVELISDGKRLWATASEEGKKIIHQIEHGLTGEEEPEKVGPTIAEWVAAGYSAKNYPTSGYSSRSTQEEIDEAIGAENADRSFSYVKAEETSVALGNQSGSGTEVVTDSANSQPAASQPEGGAPTTTTAPANSFG